MTAANLLAKEKSPYLLQHAHNPVHWYPWGEEAFARAAAEDKPVFLSVGYSTCHWCHVMAHESFEDDEVAALLNESFINIKVDREERPDVDSLYMTACHMLTGQGGWPLTILMTPDRKPFFAATYLPKESRHGRTGLLELVPRVMEIWNHRRSEVTESAESITGHIQQHVNSRRENGGKGDAPALDTVEAAINSLADAFDRDHGGFGSSPKFPSPHNLLLLLRGAMREEGETCQFMVQKTLTAMRMGGLFDHVGYGFHRYSTDERWLLPHFEKMLYDQAMLALAYAEGWKVTGDPLFRQTAEEVFSYVMRDMTSSDGAFYSAEDADSEDDAGHREEGWFYTFTMEEIRSLPDELGGLASRVFGAASDGNFQDEATGRHTGRNILHIERPLGWWAGKLGLDREELDQQLEAARAHLFALRNRRKRPHLDDKVLTDWNGLMIGALARGANLFDAPQYAEAAARAAGFILSALRSDGAKKGSEQAASAPEVTVNVMTSAVGDNTQEAPTQAGVRQTLLHRYRDGEAAIMASLDDYAFLVFGLLELYQATFEPRWLEEAYRLQNEQDALFADEEHGGYYLTARDAETLLVRQKDAGDNAMPSGNSMALYNLLRLSRLLGRPEIDKRAAHLIKAFSAPVRGYPHGFSMLLCGVDIGVHGGRNVVIVGNRESPDTESLLSAVRESYLPETTVLLRPPEVAEWCESLDSLAPFTRQLTMHDGKAAAYVCENWSCSRPVSDAGELRERLGGKSR